MATVGTITPAKVQFSIGGTEVHIIDAQMNIKINNGCHYTKCTGELGVTTYMLVKGAEITRDGDLKVQTAKTGDGKGNAAIETLITKQQLTEQHDDPKDYLESIVFVVKNSGGEKKVAEISFQGFVKEFNEFEPVGTAPPKQEAEIELYDPETLKIEQ